MPIVLRILTFVALSAAILSCAERLAPTLEHPQRPGPYGVGYLSATAIDNERDDRELVIDIWYPAEKGRAASAENATYFLSGIFGMESDVAVIDVPAVDKQNLILLIFSHGYGGINRQSIPLMEALASHGFVVAAPEHTGNAQGSMTDSFDEAAARRVPDISFVIDSLFERNQKPTDVLFQRLLETKVGVLGHSFGGMTAIGTAAGWGGASADPRVAAIAPICAVIDGDRQETERNSPHAGFTEQQLNSIHLPVLLVGGTKDVKVPIENNQIAFDQLSSAPFVYKVDILGANHTHFTNVCSIGKLLMEIGFDEEDWPNIGAADLVEPYEKTCKGEALAMDEVNRLLNLYVVSFFRRHLLGQDLYTSFLDKEFASSEGAIEFAKKEKK